MNLFDLLFIVLFLAAVVTLLRAAIFAVRGRGRPALATLRRLTICAAAYLAVVAITSIFLPRTVLRPGEPHCFDDWCVAIESATRQPAGGGAAYTVTLRMFSQARGISQRERNLAIYVTDNRGRRFDPVSRPSDTPLDIRLGPQESVTTTRVFDLPSDAHQPGVVVTHEGGFPIGWLIIGYETWFHKPAITFLP
jgi:hypothetical protein